ncbi:MAG: DUF308 domain-containing protein [Clostridiales bacterium]|nr:DUF308 domain-containing protein [Clostridiales bacterium]
MKKFNWILEIAKGLLILIFGLFCLVNPVSASITLTWIFVLMILVFGIIALTDSFMLKNSYNLWWIFVIEFVVDVVLAAILLFNPDKTALLVQITGTFAIITGVFRFLRILARRDMWINNALFGLGAIAAGILFFIISEVIITSITIILGVVAAVLGIVVIIFGVRMKMGKEQ